MENEKKVVNVDEQELAQVTGGTHGSIPYENCPYYRVLLHMKEDNPDGFVAMLTMYAHDFCSKDKTHNCASCPAKYAWLIEYGVR